MATTKDPVETAEDAGLLGVTGYAPTPEETQPRVRKVQTKHVIIFWAGTAAGLSVAAYAYHAAKYKFEAKKVAGYMKNGTELVYSLGYLMEKAHQTRMGGAGAPPPSGSPPPGFPKDFPFPTMASTVSEIDPASIPSGSV